MAACRCLVCSTMCHTKIKTCTPHIYIRNFNYVMRIFLFRHTFKAILTNFKSATNTFQFPCLVQIRNVSRAKPVALMAKLLKILSPTVYCRSQSGLLTLLTSKVPSRWDSLTKKIYYLLSNLLEFFQERRCGVEEATEVWFITYYKIRQLK